MRRPDIDGAPVYTPPPPTQPPAEQPWRPDAGVPQASPRRRGLGARSLTGQLVAGVVGLVVVIVGTIGATTYYSQKYSLYQRLDQQLRPIAGGNAGHLQSCINNLEPKCYLDDDPGGYRAADPEWVVQLNESGTSMGGVRSGTSLKLMQLSSGQARAIAGNPDVVRAITTTDGEQLHVAARTVSTPSGPLIVASGLSTDGVRKSLATLVFIELIIGAIAVLLASGATAYGVRFTLRRLRRVTVTAQEVAHDLSPEGAGLDRRVPGDDPDTEVGQLATSFNMMLSAVETQFAARVESEERMRQFMADASHELRTPLTSIRGYAELARMQRAAGGHDNATTDNLDRIEFEGTRMSRLVEDLLMLARGDARDRVSERQFIEIDGLLDDAVNGSRAAFPARTIDVDVVGDPHVIGDGDQLLRVIRNLVTNAAVHTDPDRAILVRAFSDGAGVTMQVIDGGPGLSPEDAAHVFERFWRADKARTRARGGSGLGLSIVASIVRAHGGTVRFDSTVAGGSTVTVRLPAAEPA